MIGACLIVGGARHGGLRPNRAGVSAYLTLLIVLAATIVTLMATAWLNWSAPAEVAVAIAAGRVLCGLALGIVMAVGSTWISELITRSGGDPAAGPRKASMCLTMGFLIGAALAVVPSEGEALSGAAKTIEAQSPVLFIESIKIDKEQLSRVLQDLGYKIYAHGMSVLCVHADDPIVTHVRLEKNTA